MNEQRIRAALRDDSDDELGAVIADSLKEVPEEAPPRRVRRSVVALGALAVVALMWSGSGSEPDPVAVDAAFAHYGTVETEVAQWLGTTDMDEEIEQWLSQDPTQAPSDEMFETEDL
ncbi:MAG: hypothetical protein AAFQ82_14260 [Myxococcota bacterium]